MKNAGEKMNLSKEEIDKRIKEYNENCESNCITLMKDKKVLKEIIKNVKKNK